MGSDSKEILRRWYDGPYGQVTASANGSIFERYMHQMLEQPFGPGARYPRVLELGANRGEHLAYVTHFFDEYVVSDLLTPKVDPAVIRGRHVTAAACDAAAIPFPDGAFDRVVMTCVMHHVDSPLDTALEMRRVVRPGGVVSILVPTDPGLAYRWGKSLTSGRLARRKGVSDEMRMVDAVAHHNHFRSISRQLEFAFRADRVRVRWRPFGVPSVELNAFTVWQIRRSLHDAHEQTVPGGPQ